MNAFIEKLHDTASAKHNGIEWVPGEQPGHGRLVIEMGQGRGGGKRSCVTYAISEFATTWDGRAFRLVKADAGTDPESNTYSVFVPRTGERGHLCDCKGFTYGKGRKCKHIEAVIALLENRWV